jgi:hypothetical protein
MRVAFTRSTFTDAGLLREYIAGNYGSVLTCGGSAEIYFRALRLVKRLAHMTGIAFEEVFAEIRADYAAMEDAE